MDKEKITEHGYQDEDNMGTEITVEQLLEKMRKKGK